jgi:hypothetical protein
VSRACLSRTSGIVFTALVARFHSPVGRGVSISLSDSVSSPSGEARDQLHDHVAKFLYHARDHVSTLFRSRYHFFRASPRRTVRGFRDRAPLISHSRSSEPPALAEIRRRCDASVGRKSIAVGIQEWKPRAPGCSREANGERE